MIILTLQGETLGIYSALLRVFPLFSQICCTNRQKSGGPKLPSFCLSQTTHTDEAINTFSLQLEWLLLRSIHRPLLKWINFLVSFITSENDTCKKVAAELISILVRIRIRSSLALSVKRLNLFESSVEIEERVQDTFIIEAGANANIKRAATCTYTCLLYTSPSPRD